MTSAPADSFALLASARPFLQHQDCHFAKSSPHEQLDKDLVSRHTQTHRQLDAKQALPSLVLMGFRLCSDCTQIK